MTPARPYAPRFEAYIAPARAHPQLWRLALGLVLIAVVYFGIAALIFGLYAAVYGLASATIMMGRVAAAVDPLPTLLLLTTFLGMALGPILAARLLHRRSAGSLVGRGARVVRDFTLAAATVAFVYALLSLPWLASFEAAPGLDPWLWLRLLPLAALGVLLQTFAEELVFRGYLLQQLAARFRSPLVWLVLPAAIFGALHYDPRVHDVNTWGVIAVVTGFGIVAGDLTRRTGSLGAAWGLHFANNALGLLVLATDGGISGLALFRTPYAASDSAVTGMLAGDALALAAVWLVVSRLTAR